MHEEFMGKYIFCLEAIIHLPPKLTSSFVLSSRHLLSLSVRTTCMKIARTMIQHDSFILWCILSCWYLQSKNLHSCKGKFRLSAVLYLQRTRKVYALYISIYAYIMCFKSWILFSLSVLYTMTEGALFW